MRQKAEDKKTLQTARRKDKYRRVKGRDMNAQGEKNG
jgi:hypothetical protein